jgi:4-methylaminobutanoate oxidase (formaldehyde-forming)
MEDQTESLCCLTLWGPESRQVLGSVCENDLSNAAFPYMTAQSIVINSITVWSQRVSYVGELGWELYIQPGDAVAVMEALMDAGSQFGIQPAGYKALDALRIEKGYLYWSGDITPEDNPFAAGLGVFVDLNKPDFIGKEALAKIQKQGLSTRLVALTMDAGGNLYGGESVYANGRVIDRVRSGNYGYTIGKDIGLVYLPVELAVAGTELEVQVMGERVKATVADLPLVDPKGLKLRV